MIQKKDSVDRRSFLKTGGRLLALGGLLITGIGLGSRKSETTGTEICRLKLPCRECGRENSCSDPARRSEEQKMNSGVSSER